MPDRDILLHLLQQDSYVDLVIPRGGEGLIRFVSDNSRIPVIQHYKGICHVFVDKAADFCVSFVALGVLGVLPAEGIYTLLAQIFSFTYFGFFILLWFYSKNEKTKPLPVRLT